MRAIEFFSVSILATSYNTGIGHDILLIIDDGVEFLGRNTKQIANLVGERTEVPDVGNGNDELNMSRTLAAHLLLSNFHATTVADNALIADALVLTASTLVILGGTEDALTEKSVTLRLVGAVVDGLWLGNLAETALEDFLR